MGEPSTCDVCGRELRTPASRARGRGPVCDAKARTSSEAFIPRRADRVRSQRMAEQVVRNWRSPSQTGPDLLDAQAADPDQDGAS